MSSNLIFICGDASASNVVTKEFKVKNLKNLTVGRLSQIQVFSKPYTPQFAYAGYKANIEAFVCATLRKTKLLTNQEEYPLPEDYIPSVPLPLPQVICKFQTRLTEGQTTRIIEGWKREEIIATDVGKGGPCFSILKPSWKIMFSGLPTLAQPFCPRVDKRAQVQDAILLRPIYQFIDGFLATNTYPYQSKHFVPQADSRSAEMYLGKAVEVRTEDNFYRDGYGSTKLKKVSFGDIVEAGRAVDQEETVDLTPNIETERSIGNTVFVAKPSPLPSSTSWGAPASVPNLGGLVFPYFPGMLIYDLPGTRDLISRLIFRCLGGEGTKSKEAYIKIRQNLGSTLNTPQGLILGHVLKGIELALDAQAQLYLLFDQRDYLGFCLLGSEFRVWAHGGWREARSATELRDDLKEVTTATQSLDELLTLLKSLTASIETSFVESLTVEELQFGGRLLDVLGKLDEADEIDEENQAKIVALIGRCNIPSTYRAITVSNLLWAIRELTVNYEIPFDNQAESVYVPATKWAESASKQYKVLASFGPRSFSFRNAIGDELPIVTKDDPRANSHKFMLCDGVTRKEIWPFIVYTKTIREAMKDWDTVINTSRVKMDFTERAGGVRGNKFWSTEKTDLLLAFSDAMEAGAFKTKSVKSLGKRKERDTDKKSDEGPIMDSLIDSFL